jgi:hypothetical protein
MSKNSITPSCAAFTSGSSTNTTMPSLVTSVEQAAWSFGAPSIFTRHIRHCPTIDSRGW